VCTHGHAGKSSCLGGERDLSGRFALLSSHSHVGSLRCRDGRHSSHMGCCSMDGMFALAFVHLPRQSWRQCLFGICLCAHFAQVTRAGWLLFTSANLLAHSCSPTGLSELEAELEAIECGVWHFGEKSDLAESVTPSKCQLEALQF
jgi:hypothetical protein